MNKQTKEGSSISHKILTVIGIVLCVILIPILIVNCTLLIKGWTNKDMVPTIGTYAPMIVLTDSMSGSADDAFNGGDLIFIKTIKPEDVKASDVISFFDPEGNGTSVVSHRVMEIIENEGKLYFNTKGDANPSADKVSVPAENVIGIYTGFRIAGAGRVAMFMQTTTGLIVCVFVPIVLLVGWDVIRRKRYDKQHEADKDALLAELEELRKLKAEQASNADSDNVSANSNEQTNV